MRLIVPTTLARASAPFLGAVALLGAPTASRAHELGLELRDLRRGVEAIEQTLALYAEKAPVPGLPQTPGQQRRALGEAEVEHALGHTSRALRILVGRLEDPRFRALPEHVDALLLVSEVLERSGELAGAMSYAEEALEASVRPRQAAEAGARWFRLARSTQRLDGRLEMFARWRQKGGLEAAGDEASAQVRYEVGFALRAEGDGGRARAVLRRVPPGSRFGSRATYLAATTFVEDGDLANAERWFAALMDWPIPKSDPRQRALEREVRALAALSAARLRFERGALEEARAAYAAVPPGSRHRREACWELAYLEAERGLRRAALAQLDCVRVLGAPGVQQVDLALLEASLLAHLDRYADSLDAYVGLYESVRARRDLVAEAFDRVEAPAELLFSGMERTAAERGAEATPGPATLLGRAWTPAVDLAYRVDRGVLEVLEVAEGLVREIRAIETVLSEEGAFEPLRLRQRNLRRLLQEIDHLAGHAGEMELSVDRAHRADASGARTHDHGDQRGLVRDLIRRLAESRVAARAQLEALEREGEARLSRAEGALRGLRAELAAVRREASDLRGEARAPCDAAARAALDAVVARLDDAAMRAEVGVLDTFWLKKQRRTRAIERLLDEQEATERRLDEALGEGAKP